ncbi:Ig-like domain-containing protein [Bradyrhizobium sp. LHD-71]|uniref:Ig-like domain-containing protein n=1 Tax=Bradyrhizobium sp. LHD-71 TaxID=3072141 RepID=UPI00280F9628|nr:Ig-like domain-containing protein [Bradyrhizobium sp. LHD-71]MDQ8728058.1 Ig-like domain-containing protein [Bradyrhizobium sp. LHD-71]
MDFSTSNVIKQNTLGQSEGFPVGVPKTYSWYKGWDGRGMQAPPADFTAVEGWGAIYQQAGAPAYSNPAASVEVANAKTYIHLKATGQWVLVQDQSSSSLTGGHFVPDFVGNAGHEMKVTSLAGGGATFAAPPSGHNDHFWYQSRGTYAAGTIDSVYVQMDMRVTDPNLNLVAIVGADWWRDAHAPYLDDHSNNPAAGSSNWVKLSTEWKTLGYYSMSAAELQKDLPPSLRGAATSTPPIGSKADKTPPTPPTISGFALDAGAAGATKASALKLSGTAEADSTVTLFDGSTQLGTARANASGTWTITTAQLSNTTYNFTATATDAAGNTSPTSSPLDVELDAVRASSSPSSPSPNDAPGSMKKSSDATSATAVQWASLGDNNGVHQPGPTAATHSYQLALRPDSTGPIPPMELLTSESFISLALLFGAIAKMTRNGSSDRKRGESRNHKRK